MKSLFENPTYQKVRNIFVFLCLGAAVATNLCDYIPDTVLGSRILKLMTVMMLMPQLVEDSYYWWQKKKLSKT
jgi:hypothetical protein